ncbi:unnamed protein product [Trichobilharzia regenti]|nr:unnamed protein product [Trichobilharzia regenti]
MLDLSINDVTTDGTSSVDEKKTDPLSNEKKTQDSSVPQQLYEEAMNLLEKGDIQSSAGKSALELLNEASRQGYTKAQEQLALLTLLGGHTTDPFQNAYSAFEQLSNSGNPRGQFGLGFLYASGLHVNASIPHALIYFTFAALGGDNFADMALVIHFVLSITSFLS